MKDLQVHLHVDNGQVDRAQVSSLQDQYLYLGHPDFPAFYISPTVTLQGFQVLQYDIDDLLDKDQASFLPFL